MIDNTFCECVKTVKDMLMLFRHEVKNHCTVTVTSCGFFDTLWFRYSVGFWHPRFNYFVINVPLWRKIRLTDTGRWWHLNRIIIDIMIFDCINKLSKERESESSCNTSSSTHFIFFVVTLVISANLLSLSSIEESNKLWGT